MSTNIYGGFIGAQKTTPANTIVRYLPIVVCARSENEANGIAMRDCRSRLPTSEGWTNHNASTMEIPERFIAAAVIAMEG